VTPFRRPPRWSPDRGEAEDLVLPAVDQPPRHVAAHAAEPYECDLHATSPL
jgi:hypothetical protein